MGSTSAFDFPGFDRIYDLSNALKPGFVTARIVTSDGSIAGENDAVISDPARVLHWTSVGGQRRSAVVWTSSHFFLIDEALADALAKAGVTGWIPQPAECLDVEVESSYVGFRITGRCGPQDTSRGTWVRDEAAPGPWKVVLRGLYFDESTWDGSDVFSPQDMYACLLTSKAARVFVEADVENIQLTKAVEFETPELVLRFRREIQERK